MKVFYSDKHALHVPKWYLADGTIRDCPEMPARVDAIRSALQNARHETLAPGPDIDPWPAIRGVHTLDYLEYLRHIYPVWFAEFACDVLPETFPRRVPGMKAPKKPAAQAGFYCFDLAAPITAGTWDAAWESARVALAAAREALANRAASYALCRPPGHHAGPDYCGGFCYLNNAAIAAEYLAQQTKKRIAILDVDYHHGNGTQDIFYRRSDILFVSIHADPDAQYPYFWGHADETGMGLGAGFTANFPLPRGAAEALWLETLDRAIDRIAAFNPEAIVVSLGVDTSKKDDVGDFQLSTGGFEKLGRRLASLRLPTTLIQEGGYNLAEIGNSVTSILSQF